MIESSYLLLQLKFEEVNSLLIILTNHDQDIKQVNKCSDEDILAFGDLSL